MATITNEQQAAQDSIHDLVRDSLGSIMQITYADISSNEKKKLVHEIGDNLKNIDTLRRNC